MPQTNAAGLALIKSFEGCELTAYQDVAGIWTIGWGHTPSHSGQTVTQAQADALLVADLHVAENVVNASVSRSCSPNQFAAMVSFEFNTGSLTQSSVLRLFNAGDIPGAADAFLLWNKATVGGELVPVAGLTRRRGAERALFLTP